MVHPEKGDHRNHPGFTNGLCPLRITVNASRGGTSHNGYACSHTGGHCVADEHCKKRVKDHEEDQERHAHIYALMEQHHAAKEEMRRWD